MDFAGNALAMAHHVYARADPPTQTNNGRPPIYKVVGIVLAISSGLFIGVSFVLKKMGLLKANVKYNEEAGEGYGYLKNGWWWGGMILMIIGEICNFVAYAFVDAILVTPLGALSVVVTTILSAIFLKERLSFVGKVGCFNCIIGSIVIVISAPEQSAVARIQDMKRLMLMPGFLSFAGVIIVACLVLAFWAGPKYGKKTMLVYLSICSLIGGLSVVATQGLGAAVIRQIAGEAQFNQWFLYVLLVFVIITLLVEIIYLNKALNLFNAALVTPTYYVYFTSSTIITSAILFQGFKGTPASIANVVMGFLQICAGVILLQLSKSSKDVPDVAVFKGDLDQVRTVAEQEEPEYEPRADTIRGGGALLRSLSVARQKKQVEEAKRLQEEQLQPIGEDEAIEWDGLRRRKTIVGDQHTGSLTRRKSLHPPLGMSQFPDENERHNEENDLHPGFFTRLRSFSRSKSDRDRGHSQAVPLTETSRSESDNRAEGSSSLPHVYGLPAGLQNEFDQDTSYKASQSSPAIHWASNVDEKQKSTDHLSVPKQPQKAKRQFSFQHVFQRHKSDDGTGRPTSGGALSPLSFVGKSPTTAHSQDRATEEERMGLVKGDSTPSIRLAESEPTTSSPVEYSSGDDKGWQRAPRPGMTPASGVSPHTTAMHSGRATPQSGISPGSRTPPGGGSQPRPQDLRTRIRKIDGSDTIDDSNDKDLEKGGGKSGGAFI